MTQATRYARVLAKIGAERSKLLSEAKFKTLTESKNLAEFASQLRDTAYQEQIAKVPLPLTSRKLERALNENLIETCVKIIKNSPKTAKEYLSLYLLRFEVENIKALVKAVKAKLSLEQKCGKIYFSAEEYFKYRALMEEAAKASTTKQVQSFFKRTMYNLAISMGLQGFEETGSTARLDILLDKVYYEKLYSAYDALRRKEKPHAKFYASMENDSFTLLTLLRGKTLNYDPNWLRLALPHDNFNLKPKTVEELVTAPDYESALRVILESFYAKFFLKAQTPEETLSSAEKAFKKAIFDHAKKSRITENFNIGVALAYLEYKEAEAHNLIALSAGVEAGLSADFLLSQLLV